MRYFTVSELSRSATAKQKGISNVPNQEQSDNLVKLTDNVLDPIRELWGKPITVNSGFRSLELNKAVGGASSSQHLKGQAADITTSTKSGNKELFFKIKDSGIPFDQLIDEADYSWIHVSYSENPRGQVLHL